MGGSAVQDTLAGGDGLPIGTRSVNGTSAKAAQQVKAGDEVRVRVSGIERIVVVVKPITKRVSAVLAADCLQIIHHPHHRPN